MVRTRRFRPTCGVAVVLVGLQVTLPSFAFDLPIQGSGSKGRSATSQPSQTVKGAGKHPPTRGSYTYRPAGRRDPFASLLQMHAQEQERPDLPPLQRYALSDLTVTGILWSRDGYRAMVRTPDGKAYVIRPGTIVGTNRGIVEDIGESGLRVKEDVIDIYGRTREQMRIMRLHPAEEQ